MKDVDAIPARVGQQLATRREDLDLIQEELAQRIGVSTATVSAAERGRNVISRRRRPDWERALGLRKGTLSRAYRDGSDIEITDMPVTDDEASTGSSPIEPDEDPQQVLAEARELIARGQELMARAEEILERRRRA
jgi:transcriptional regulator with XRE-family HTH domain